jgi:ribosomal protein L37AE/L43A
MKHKLRVLPDCPKCDENQLRLSRAGHDLWMHCAECGWKSGIITIAILPSDADNVIDDVIAAAVLAQRNGVTE